jgi:hypothetical protein
MNMAMDEVRAAETAQIARDGHEPLLKKSRWCILKRKENLIRKAAAPPPRSASPQLDNRSLLSAQGRFPAVLEIQLAHLGRHVPGLLVQPDHAQPH